MQQQQHIRRTERPKRDFLAVIVPRKRAPKRKAGGSLAADESPLKKARLSVILHDCVSFPDKNLKSASGSTPETPLTKKTPKGNPPLKKARGTKTQSLEKDVDREYYPVLELGPDCFLNTLPMDCWNQIVKLLNYASVGCLLSTSRAFKGLDVFYFKVSYRHNKRDGASNANVPYSLAPKCLFPSHRPHAGETGREFGMYALSPHQAKSAVPQTPKPKTHDEHGKTRGELESANTGVKIPSSETSKNFFSDLRLRKDFSSGYHYYCKACENVVQCHRCTSDSDWYYATEAYFESLKLLEPKKRESFVGKKKKGYSVSTTCLNCRQNSVVLRRMRPAPPPFESSTTSPINNVYT